MKNVVVPLAKHELTYAGMVGVLRRVQSIFDHLNKNNYTQVSSWQTDIDGACGEMAFAKHMDAYWDGYVGTLETRDYKRRDVAGCQVRATHYPHGHLILRPNDNDIEAPYVLVICTPPRFRLVGAMSLLMGKVAAYRVGDHWEVPQSDLDDLPEKGRPR